MNNTAPVKELACAFCVAVAKDDSKHRGRFNRRHPSMCQEHVRKQEEGRRKLAADLLLAQADLAENAEGVRCVEVEGGRRVNMSVGGIE